MSLGPLAVQRESFARLDRCFPYAICSTIVIIFAPLTLVHVVIAIYVSSISYFHCPDTRIYLYCHHSWTTSVARWAYGAHPANLLTLCLKSCSSARGLRHFRFVSTTSSHLWCRALPGRARHGTINYQDHQCHRSKRWTRVRARQFAKASWPSFASLDSAWPRTVSTSSSTCSESLKR